MDTAVNRLRSHSLALLTASELEAPVITRQPHENTQLLSNYQRYSCGIFNRNDSTENSFEWDINFRSFVSRYLPELQLHLQNENCDKNDSILISTILSNMPENLRRWAQEQRQSFQSGSLSEDRIRCFHSAGLLPVIVHSQVAGQHSQQHQQLNMHNFPYTHSHHSEHSVLQHPGSYRVQAGVSDSQQPHLPYLLVNGAKAASSIGVPFDTNRYSLTNDKIHQRSSLRSFSFDSHLQHNSQYYVREGLATPSSYQSSYVHLPGPPLNTNKPNTYQVNESETSNSGKHVMIQQKEPSKELSEYTRVHHDTIDTDSSSSSIEQSSLSLTNQRNLSPQGDGEVNADLKVQGSATTKKKKRRKHFGEQETSPNPTITDDCDSQDDVDNPLEDNFFREKTGRWSPQEHKKFLEGLKSFGKKWTKIASFIGTRTAMQVRTHAQKYFQKLDKINHDFNSIDGELAILPKRLETVPAPSSKHDNSIIPRKKMRVNNLSEETTTAENSESTYLSDTEHEVASLLAGMSKNRCAWL